MLGVARQMLARVTAGVQSLGKVRTRQATCLGLSVTDRTSVVTAGMSDNDVRPNYTLGRGPGPGGIVRTKWNKAQLQPGSLHSIVFFEKLSILTKLQLTKVP